MSAWLDRCLGPRERISDDPDVLVVAVAAATVALDGIVTSPVLEPKSWAPARQAELELTVALAALASQHDATAMLDRAFAAADTIDQAPARDRVLLWGVDALAHRDPVRAAAWAGALRDDDFHREVAAHELRRLDESSQRQALGRLPPMWGIRTDEAWPGYPRWLGSASAAACVALAGPALCEVAEHLTRQITEDWRQNREYRLLALAWARAGELERALIAASRMPGTERSSAIVDLLELFGDDPAIDLPRLAALAREAIAATRSEPFILGAADLDESRAFIDSAVTGAVEAAIARRHVNRGDLASARASIETIHDGLSVHHEAALHLACAQIARGEMTVDQVSADFASRPFAQNLVEVAAVSCLDLVPGLLHRVKFADRQLGNVTRNLIDQGRFDAASVLLSRFWDGMEKPGELAAALVTGLTLSGQVRDALVLVRTLPAPEYPIYQRMVLAAAYRLIVALVHAGELAEAQALRAELAPRLAAATS